MEETVTCPYCGHDNGVYIEGDEIGDDEIAERECENCEKIFGCRISIDVSCDTDGVEMPCENGEPCKFDEWRTLWERNEYRRCKHCGKEERRTNEA